MVTKKTTTAKTTKKPATVAKTAEEQSAALWKVSSKIDELAYVAAAIRDVINLYTSQDYCMEYWEALNLMAKELDRMEDSLIACSDEIIKLRSL
jgi:hypothetical protein